MGRKEPTERITINNLCDYTDNMFKLYVHPDLSLSVSVSVCAKLVECGEGGRHGRGTTEINKDSMVGLHNMGCVIKWPNSSKLVK